jgi:hypothetical protein
VTTSTINEALERFVEAGSEPGAGPWREGVVELFRSYLDNYARETLDQANRIRTVLGPRGTGETAARVCVDLVRWPVDEGYVRTYGRRRGGVRR